MPHMWAVPTPTIPQVGGAHTHDPTGGRVRVKESAPSPPLLPPFFFVFFSTFFFAFFSTFSTFSSPSAAPTSRISRS